MASSPHLHAVPGLASHAAVDNSLSGVVTALTEMREWRGVLARNDLSRRIVFRREPPYLEGSVTGRPLVDLDFDRIRLWFEDSRKVAFSRKNLLEGARIVAAWNAFHPVRDYLEPLEWDGVGRVDTWLEDYCAVVPTSDAQRALVRAVARKWLLSCVARALLPGSKVDTMLVLEGKQGIGKSTALRALAGPAFFRDCPLDFGASDACQAIQGVWIYEIPELGALLRGNPAHGKAFLTSVGDHFRLPYSRTPETVPRSVVFCGTVNHGGYLRDATGNRRFWVVRCVDTLRTEALRADRDALWAEACHRYRSGESWHMTVEEDELMQGEHEGRLVVDAWEEAIALWTATATAGREATFTMTELLEGALQLRASARTPAVTSRVSAILESLGYERRRSPKPPRAYYYARSAPDGGRAVRPSICPIAGEDTSPA